MEQARVRVVGPSRTVLVMATGALVAVTSAATALVVLTGTGGVTPQGRSLAPLPPAAAAPARPPLVVLPPGALGLSDPPPPGRSTADGPPTRRSTPAARTAGLTPFVLTLDPALPAGGLLPPQAPELPRRAARVPGSRPVSALPALPAVVSPVVVPAVDVRRTPKGPKVEEPEAVELLAAPTREEQVPDRLPGKTAALSTGEREDARKRPGASEPVMGAAPRAAAQQAGSRAAAAKAAQQGAANKAAAKQAAGKKAAKKAAAHRSAAKQKAAAKKKTAAHRTGAAKKKAASRTAARRPGGTRP